MGGEVGVFVVQAFTPNSWQRPFRLEAVVQQWLGELHRAFGRARKTPTSVGTVDHGVLAMGVHEVSARMTAAEHQAIPTLCGDIDGLRHTFRRMVEMFSDAVCIHAGRPDEPDFASFFLRFVAATDLSESDRRGYQEQLHDAYPNPADLRLRGLLIEDEELSPSRRERWLGSRIFDQGIVLVPHGTESGLKKTFVAGILDTIMDPESVLSSVGSTFELVAALRSRGVAIPSILSPAKSRVRSYVAVPVHEGPLNRDPVGVIVVVSSGELNLPYAHDACLAVQLQELTWAPARILCEIARNESESSTGPQSCPSARLPVVQ